ncbi:hypothetical protein QJS10_CPA16g01087 [Acorus calamus]|uniref:Uncharacterized protein n=1 Tax=Acorus calamus TaxID=4465 RepID=A0AAV9CZY0_ACOCL|nr:hypothetical protein QJS10_CPA16g01087 [Acorus calamus]
MRVTRRRREYNAGQEDRSPHKPVGEVLSPTPSAQPTTFPMYGVTQGSLHPQG